MKKFIAVAFLALLVAGPAQALTIIYPTSGTINVTRWEGNQTSQGDINLIINPIMGYPDELYKSDGGDQILQSSYTNTYSGAPGENNNALIEWIEGTPYATGTVYALVKDGSSTPAWYLFNVTALGWDGMEDLYFSDFWVGPGGSISHVTLYGGYSVPDGGSVAMLLGAALMGLAGLRRFMK